MTTITREVRDDGTVYLRGAECRYVCVPLQADALLLAIAGRETGELGRAPLGEVAVAAALHPPLRLFVDMSHVTDINLAVADDWTAWFQANRAALRSVHALTPTLFVRVTVAVSQLFSRTGDLIRIHTDPETFAAELSLVAPSFDRSAVNP